MMSKEELDRSIKINEIIVWMKLGSCLVIHSGYLLLVQQKITPSPAELSLYTYPSVSKKKITNHLALEADMRLSQKENSAGFWEHEGSSFFKRLQDKVYLALTDKHTHLRSSIPPAESFLVNTQLFMCPSGCLIAQSSFDTYMLIFLKALHNG